MREYTGDRVLDVIRRGYASTPDAPGVPTEPDLQSYFKGVLPLETLPAPWWNWFIQKFTDNLGRSADAIGDIYAALTNIMEEAGQVFGDNPEDLRNALMTLWKQDGKEYTDQAIHDFSHQQIGADGSWAMFTPMGGYYVWKADTGLLSYAGPGEGNIKWLNYTVSGGGPNFDTSSGTMIGTFDIWYDIGDGKVRHYYRQGHLSETILNTDELITLEVANNIISAVSQSLKIPVVIQYESQLPSNPSKGDYYVINYMDVTAPGQQGRAWWDGSQWQKIVDRIYEPDHSTISLDSNTRLTIAQNVLDSINEAIRQAQAVMDYAYYGRWKIYGLALDYYQNQAQHKNNLPLYTDISMEKSSVALSKSHILIAPQKSLSPNLSFRVFAGRWRGFNGRANFAGEQNASTFIIRTDQPQHMGGMTDTPAKGWISLRSVWYQSNPWEFGDHYTTILFLNNYILFFQAGRTSNNAPSKTSIIRYWPKEYNPIEAFYNAIMKPTSVPPLPMKEFNLPSSMNYLFTIQCHDRIYIQPDQSTSIAPQQGATSATFISINEQGNLYYSSVSGYFSNPYQTNSPKIKNVFYCKEDQTYIHLIGTQILIAGKDWPVFDQGFYVGNGRVVTFPQIDPDYTSSPFFMEQAIDGTIYVGVSTDLSTVYAPYAPFNPWYIYMYQPGDGQGPGTWLEITAFTDFQFNSVSQTGFIRPTKIMDVKTSPSIEMTNGIYVEFSFYEGDYGNPNVDYYNRYFRSICPIYPNVDTFTFNVCTISFRKENAEVRDIQFFRFADALYLVFNLTIYHERHFMHLSGRRIVSLMNIGYTTSSDVYIFPDDIFERTSYAFYRRTSFKTGEITGNSLPSPGGAWSVHKLDSDYYIATETDIYWLDQDNQLVPLDLTSGLFVPQSVSPNNPNNPNYNSAQPLSIQSFYYKADAVVGFPKGTPL